MKLASRLSQIQPSATLALSARLKELKGQGIDVVGMGAGEPDFSTPPAICAAAQEAIRAGMHKYTPASGTPDLRKACAAFFQKTNGIAYKPEQIIVSCGAKHSIFNAVFALCEAGDEVIVPVPYWLSYPEIVRLAEATPVFVDTRQEDSFKLTPDALRKAITPKTRLLLLNSPSNPTGVVYTQAELDALAAVILEKGIVVLSDEIYNELLFDKTPFATISRSPGDIADRLVLVNGVSKTYAMTGWRIGYLAAPLPLAKAIGSVQSHSTSNPTAIAQAAALAALREPIPELDTMRKTFQERLDYVTSRLDRMPKISYVRPQGAFYVFINVAKTGKPAKDVAVELMEKIHVGVVPGEPFGSSDHVRISFATSMENLQKAMDRLEKYFGG